jgi:hypothetical protein
MAIATQVEIVVETVLNRRTDSQAGLGIEFQNGLGHYMGGRVSKAKQI